MTEKLEKILKNALNLSEKEFSTSLTKEDVATWDSLAHMQLITGLEEEYDIEFEVEEIVAMLSVSEIVKALKNKGVAVEE